ncbi:MAG TPA: uridine kinase [Motilibacteraceae bacterium]|nr:uridine kinase [Motilibacteraceae bacterium]
MLSDRDQATSDVSARPLRGLADRVLAAPPRAGATRVVAVDGPSGSGKTTLAGRLAALLGGPVVHLDDLYPGWDGLADAVPRLVEWVLEPLGRGEPARYRRYDWVEGVYAEWHEVPTAPVLVVEGCASGSLAAAPYLSLLVWVEAPHDLRMERGIARDGEAYRPHWERWARQEDELYRTQRTRERADVRVDGAPQVPYDEASEYVPSP